MKRVSVALVVVAFVSFLSETVFGLKFGRPDIYSSEPLIWVKASLEDISVKAPNSSATLNTKYGKIVVSGFAIEVERGHQNSFVAKIRGRLRHPSEMKLQELGFDVTPKLELCKFCNPEREWKAIGKRIYYSILSKPGAPYDFSVVYARVPAGRSAEGLPAPPRIKQCEISLAYAISR